MLFRELTHHDMPACFDIRVEAWVGEDTEAVLAELGITPESVAQLFEAGSHKGWGCEMDGKIVGFVIANRLTGEVWVIGVYTDYQKRGIATKLMRLAEDWLWACGHTEIWLHTYVDENNPAVSFYRKRGWRDANVIDNDRKMTKTRPLSS